MSTIKGATIGSVIPTKGAIIPAAVGVMVAGCAVRTSLQRSDLPKNYLMFARLSKPRCHSRTDNGGLNDRGACQIFQSVQVWDSELAIGLLRVEKELPFIARANSLRHLGTLGTGNHFVELTIDADDSVVHAAFRITRYWAS